MFDEDNRDADYRTELSEEQLAGLEQARHVAGADGGQASSAPRSGWFACWAERLLAGEATR